VALASPCRLSEAIAAYAAHLAELNRAQHTITSTTLDLAGVLTHFGDVELASATPEALQAHVRWLRSSRNNHTASLRRKIASLKGLFRHAHAVGWIAADPAAGLIYPPPVRPAVLALRGEEEAAVVVAASHDPAWLLLVLLLLDCGLKRDEALALRADDVVLGQTYQSSHLTVRRTARAKRARRRSLPVSQRLRSALARQVASPLPGTHLIDLSVRGVNFVVETVGHRAAIERIAKLTPEILRDTFAVRQAARWEEEERRAADAGANPRQILRLRKQHDLALLTDLGLSPTSDMAGRYRQAAQELRSTDGGALGGPTQE
jgi:site-specific recombinase XerD